MILRIWKTDLVEGRASELEEFGKKYSEPMFKEFDGFMGNLFVRTDTKSLTITLWDSLDSISKMNQSPRYKEVVKKIKEAGFLTGDQEVEVFEVKGGYLNSAFLEYLTKTP